MVGHKIGTMNEALLSLTEGLRNAARNPNIHSYSPHAKQLVFHKSSKKKKLYIGGNRSGKTTGGVTEDIWRATNTHPYRSDLNAVGPNRGRVVAVDFVQGVEKILFPQFRQWLAPSMIRGGVWEDAYDKTLRTLYFENGSFIEFMSYDQDLDKFAGTSRHWIHFDEEPPKPIWQECMARLVDTHGDYWITMTPVEGMTWIYDDLYEKNTDLPEGDEADVEIIEVDMTENPYLNAEAIQAFKDSLDEEEISKRVQGKFVQVGGRVYKNFDPKIGGLHILEDNYAPDEVRAKAKDHLIVVSLDHGLNNPTAVHWHLVDRDGYAITFHEHYQKEWTINQHAQKIKQVNRAYGVTPDYYVADPSIQNRNAVTNTSIHQEYIKYGIPFQLGNNDVKAGIARVKRYMQSVGDGPPRWRVTPNCGKLIWEAQRYRWKTYYQKRLNYENNPYEEPHKKDDHAMDGLRYFIMSRPDLAASAGPSTQEIIDGLSRQGIESTTALSAAAEARKADPWDNSKDGIWTEVNHTPSADSEWVYDEYMGGIE